MAAELDRRRILAEFRGAVNMAPRELEAWLQTDESRRVGFRKPGAEESVGRASGKRIVAILRKRQADLNDEDYLHMRKVVGFVRRHSAQQPANIYTSRWRYSLMNWGHDPVKERD